MTIKKTIGSLSFVLAASVSSIALAQGLGIATNAQVGVGSAPAAANLQAGSQTNLGAGVDTQAGSSNPNASIDNRSQTAVGAQGASAGGLTQALESSGKSAVGTGRDTAAAAQADAHDAAIKIDKTTKNGQAKTSARAKVDLDASATRKAQNPN